MKTVSIEKNFKSVGTPDRIAWCDVFKGIVIILVVVGHSTGLFNRWIYQFHMAAFFFISGYTSQPKNKSMFDELLKKFYRLMIPYYVINFVGIAFFYYADKANVLDKISTTIYPEKFQDALIGLVSNTSVYCDWLGAMWFMPVLFGASLVFMVIVKICNKKSSMLLLSVLVFLISMNAISNDIHWGNKDLVGLAQFFMLIGYLFRSISTKPLSFWQYIIKSFAVAGIWGISLYCGFDFVVDWPSRKFNGGIDLLLPFFGILFVITLSKIICSTPRLEKLFSYIGQNSMSIMCFHFIGFKVAYLPLIALGWMKADEFNKLTPKSTNAEIAWLYITAVSIVTSIFLWKLLCKKRIINILLGNANSKEVCGAILKIGSIQKCKMAFELIVTTLKQAFFDIQKEMQQKNKGKKLIAIILSISIVSVGIKLYSYQGEIYVDFPYYQKQVAFGDGWLPQSQIEDYRWIGQKAEFTSFITNQETLEIKGYIPENITNISQLKILVNESDVYSIAVSNNQIIDIKLNLSGFVKKYSMNKFVIEIDGVRIPATSDADQREFSALINSLKIY